ncbi:hypothetical protein [Nevskia sp.]|uniref:hypothetical protein n=1 Tax=Nevskia sp. TaxID=1929292 RepID=UPI0025EF7294|nr:hypothetical protein [Nevskia sp.]
MKLTVVFAVAPRSIIAQTPAGKNVRFNDWLEIRPSPNSEFATPPIAKKGTRFAMDAPFKAFTAAMDELVIRRCGKGFEIA